jgi:hypothetical protein
MRCWATLWIGTKLINFALDLYARSTPMSTERGYTRINELVAALNAAMLDMEQGRLGAQGLERTTEDARELYERLVVLRHKVREARAALSAKSAEAAPAPLAVAPEAPAPPRTEVVERPPMRLDTRPDMSPRQTSLIDAIAEHDEVPAVEIKVQEQEKPKLQEQAPMQTKPAEQEKPKAQAPAPAKGPSLAEKLEHAPISDLGKAITLSQKFLFLAELFGGQKEEYEKAISAINGHAFFAEAKQYLDAEVLTKLKKAPDPEALSSFMDLVERRFKGNA